MPTSASVGTSAARDSFAAGSEAASAIASEWTAPPDLVVVFATEAHHQHELLQGIRSVLPDARISGASGEGIISDGCSRETDYFVGIMALRSDVIEFEPFLIEEYADDSKAAGRKVASLISRTPGAFGVFVFPDGLTGNCTDFLAAMHGALEDPPLILGGTSADGMHMARSWQYLDERAASGAVSGFILRGAGRIGWAVSHGCTPLGLERTVTSASDGWIREIDGEPAWAVFKEYLSGNPDTLNAEGIIHLCVGLPLDGAAIDEYGEYRIITPMQLDPGSGALYFPGGGVESGDRIRLTRRDESAIRESASACARRVAAGGDAPAFVLQFDCAGRGSVLFGKHASDAIVRPLQEAFGDLTPWLGFHTFGEIAPVLTTPSYHNYTVVLCGVYDE